MTDITLEQARERLEEVNLRIADIEDGSTYYYELGERRINGYDTEEYYDELLAFKERITNKIEELEEEEFDE